MNTGPSDVKLMLPADLPPTPAPVLPWAHGEALGSLDLVTSTCVDSAWTVSLQAFTLGTLGRYSCKWTGTYERKQTEESAGRVKGGARRVLAEPSPEPKSIPCKDPSSLPSACWAARSLLGSEGTLCAASRHWNGKHRRTGPGQRGGLPLRSRRGKVVQFRKGLAGLCWLCGRRVSQSLSGFME